MDDFFISMVEKLVAAKRGTEEAEKEAREAEDRLRRALETLETRTRRIIADADETGDGYQVAFLDEALRDVHEADRRHEVAHGQMVAARRHEALCQTVVDGLKALRG